MLRSVKTEFVSGEQNNPVLGFTGSNQRFLKKEKKLANKIFSTVRQVEESQSLLIHITYNEFLSFLVKPLNTCINA